MAAKPRPRRSLLQALPKNVAKKDDFFEERCRAILRGKLIPIIGETIRIAHIFDVDYDQELGVDNEPDDDAQDSDFDMTETENGNDEDELVLNVTEQLAQLWAQEISYPLVDDHQIARVAQYNKLIKENARTANESYLVFLKNTLLNVAEGLCRFDSDNEQLAFIEQLRLERLLSFSDIVTELDFPTFPNGRQDPLRILARLPLKIYIATGYHEFIERELEAAGKHPRSRLCFWNMRPDSVAKEHQFDHDYKPDADNPVVYHLFGMERYPESLVLSEDDYLDLLWALAKDIPGDSGERIIPPFLEAELHDSSLLLLGYRLQDWDLSVLFHGLLWGGHTDISRRLASTAIHLDLKEQPLVRDRKKAELYLKSYFGQAQLDVQFGDSDDFVAKLWQEWRRFSQGSGGLSS